MREWLSALAANAIMFAVTAVVSAQISPPRKMKDVSPVYPRESLERGDEGAVILELTVARSGAVERARVLRSECSRLEAAALAAVQQWRFESVRVNGTPMPFTVVSTVPFRLPPRYRSRAGRLGACKWTEPPMPLTEREDLSVLSVLRG
jgi:TonB family protein